MIKPINKWSKQLTAIAALWLAFAIAAGSALGQRREPQIHGTFDGDLMYTVLQPGGIPAINDPQFVTGADAAAQMSPDEPVMGVVIKGEARAYSLWQLDAHEIVNDTIGGTAIAVTW